MVPAPWMPSVLHPHHSGYVTYDKYLGSRADQRSLSRQGRFEGPALIARFAVLDRKRESYDPTTVVIVRIKG